MELFIASKNLEINQQARAYIEKKLAPLARHLKTIDQAKVEVRRERTRSAQDNVVIQATLSMNNTLLRAEERAATVNAAVDMVARALGRQVMRYKERHFTNLVARKGGPDTSIRAPEAISDGPDQEEEAVTAPSGKLVRVKRFPMKPLTVEEAAEQMELLGHDFFFFVNADDQQYNVLYRRKDGDYGVIEPEPM